MNQICLRPWNWMDFGFSCENPSSSFKSFFKKSFDSGSRGQSQEDENLKTDFQPAFHPKWAQSILNVRTELRTGLPSENRPTLVLTSVV